jgi:hypothetical protein
VGEIIINLLCTTSAILNVYKHAELGPRDSCCLSGIMTPVCNYKNKAKKKKKNPSDQNSNIELCDYT